MAVDLRSINYLAAGGCSVFLMVLGFVWYAPFLFGRMQKVALHGTEEDMRGFGPSLSMVFALADAVSVSIALAIILQLGAIDGIVGGFGVGFVLSIVLTGVSIISNSSFERRSRPLMLISLCYRLVGYSIVGIILSVW